MNLIKKMPSRKTLEDFIRGLSGKVHVYFDREKGEFINPNVKKNSS